MSQMEVPTLPSQLALLEGFYGREIHDLYSTPPWRGRGLLMGCPVWGEKYLDRFERFCLPSIMAPRNHAALAGKCRLVFYTDIPSYARLEAMTEGLENVGFDIHIRVIPKELLDIHEARDPLIKYWILGVCQNACVQMAKRAGMSYHQLHPDHVYEATYYENLVRLSVPYRGIAQTGISADVETIGPDLDKFVIEGGALVIPGRDLGDLGFRHMHKQTLMTMMNDATIPTDLPESHLWVWRGFDKLHLACCHMNAAYLSPEMCAKARSRIPATIDAELPSFMPEDFHVPTAEDGMTFIEVSDATKAHNPKRVGFEDFAKHCWLKTRYSRKWMPYVEKLCEVPIHAQPEAWVVDYGPHIRGYMPDEEIRAQHQLLMKMLLEIRGPDTIATEFIESLGFQ